MFLDPHEAVCSLMSPDKRLAPAQKCCIYTEIKSYAVKTLLTRQDTKKILLMVLKVKVLL